MQNSKLIALLRTFSPVEWRNFRQMVDSPYFNRNEALSRLCAWLAPQYPAFESVPRTSACHALGLDDAGLNHTMSFLLKLAEDFVGLEQYWKDKTAHPNNILKDLSRRGLDKNYLYTLERQRRFYDSVQQTDAALLYGQYAMEIGEAERFVRKSPRQFNASVQVATDKLDAFYLLEKLRRTCYMYTSQTILATPYRLQLVDEVCRFVGEHLDDIPVPAIEAYYRVFRMLTQEAPDADFQALKNLLSAKAESFGAEDLTDAYQYAINFCNLQLLKGKQEYATEAFELYSQSLQSGVLLEKGELSPWHFKNIVNLSLRLKQYAWAEQFVTEYTPLLPPDFQPDAWHYNFALIYHATGRFDEAILQLNKVEFTDVHYSVGAKVMLCQIYYENDNYDALESLLHAFNTFLRRNRLLAENVRAAYLNFVQLMKKILHTPRKKIPALREEVGAMRGLVAKEWIMEVLQR